MMRATSLEYRLRYPVHVLIYLLGFWAPWERLGALSFGKTTVWTTLAGFLSRENWLAFSVASRTLLLAAAALATVAALLRVWASSYLGAGIVQASTLRSARLTADGPYRHVRNPLYLGTICNAAAVALLMPPSGAVVALGLVGIEQLRLIGAEELFLRERLGAPYEAYVAAVPRLWPSIRARVPEGTDRARLLPALLSEIFFVGCAASFLFMGSSYNGTLILKGILVALGLALIARAILPPTPPAQASPATPDRQGQV